MNFIFLIVGLLLLVFSREALGQSLGRLTGPKAFAKVYFLIFLPGVAIHELSHFFMANLLLVPTGEIDLFPDEKRMGSIQVAKTDPVRQSLIGLAPLVFGTASLMAIFRFLPATNLLFYYLVFAISNTMFTSSSDRQALAGLAAWLVIILASLYLLGFWPRVTGFLVSYSLEIVEKISHAYFLTFMVNLGFVVPTWFFAKILSRRQ